MKPKKARIYIVIIALVLCLCLPVGNASASGNLTLSMTTPTDALIAGYPMQVNFNLSGVSSVSDGLSSLHFTVNYDASLIGYSSHSVSGSLSGWQSSMSGISGARTFNFVGGLVTPAPTPTEFATPVPTPLESAPPQQSPGNSAIQMSNVRGPIMSNVTVMTLTFNIKEKAVGKKTTITLSRVSATDGLGNSVSTSANSKTITFSNTTPQPVATSSPKPTKTSDVNIPSYGPMPSSAPLITPVYSAPAQNTPKPTTTPAPTKTVVTSDPGRIDGLLAVLLIFLSFLGGILVGHEFWPKRRRKRSAPPPTGTGPQGNTPPPQNPPSGSAVVSSTPRRTATTNTNASRSFSPARSVGQAKGATVPTTSPRNTPTKPAAPRPKAASSQNLGGLGKAMTSQTLPEEDSSATTDSMPAPRPPRKLS